MNEYFVEFNGNDGYTEGDVWGDNYKEIVIQVEDFLKTLGGGYANIYDEDGDFVEKIEV